MATSASASASDTGSTSIDIVDVLQRSGQATRSILAGARPQQWSAPTNCDMDVRALINHIVTGLCWAAELASGETIAGVGSQFDGDVLGDTPLAEYDRSVARAVTAFGQPGVLERICTLSYGDVPGGVLCSYKALEVFIHGWDIARATGQPATLDPELVEIVYAIFEPHAALLQASGVFAAAIDVPPASDIQTRLLAMLGRDNRA